MYSLNLSQLKPTVSTEPCTGVSRLQRCEDQLEHTITTDSPLSQHCDEQWAETQPQFRDTKPRKCFDKLFGAESEISTYENHGIVPNTQTSCNHSAAKEYQKLANSSNIQNREQWNNWTALAGYSTCTLTSSNLFKSLSRPFTVCNAQILFKPVYRNPHNAPPPLIQKKKPVLPELMYSFSLYPQLTSETRSTWNFSILSNSMQPPSFNTPLHTFPSISIFLISTMLFTKPQQFTRD